MAGPGDPPEGTPQGVPGGGEDEYRSVVFDESFVRAARLQEFSARERLSDHAPAVRSRPAWSRASGSRQALLLILLIVLAFGTAVYMGVRHPYQQVATGQPEPLRMSLIPLAPREPVPGADPQRLFESSPAAQFRVGAEGVTLPAARSTSHFSDTQVVAALASAKDYIVRSSLDPAVLTGGATRPVRLLIDPGQFPQFDRSMERPADDERHAATGWLVRFDGARVALAESQVRVRGTLAFTEVGPDRLEVVGDHTFVYALRPTAQGAAGEGVTGRQGAPLGGDFAVGQGAPDGQASLFTVRREIRFRFDREDLRDHHLEVVRIYQQAGPMSCDSDAAGHLRPLLSGQSATGGGPAETDPYGRGPVAAAQCGVLAPSAQPHLPRP
ncbi:hypothetical protein [Streptomyces sp. URMC 123]|uniref:SCO2583 family membrane protein n=1 Tax=Streptomyces sp. URMC 123 TaxID=3423403 RepID=UPI003F19DFD3